MSDTAREYSQSISRARQKETGEVFTPVHLIDCMISKVPNICELGTTFLEPAAGDGNIVIRVIKYKVENNSACEINERIISAVGDVYACEYMKDNHSAIISRVLEYVDSCGVTEETKNICKRILDEQIAYCNTMDPWDSTDGRKFPTWLLESLSPIQIKCMKESSVHYSNSKKSCELSTHDISFIF